MFKNILLLLILFLVVDSAFGQGDAPLLSRGNGESTYKATVKLYMPNTIISRSGATATLGILNVPGGGTGLATLTANNVILGNGTSAPLFVAPGTSGNILTSNGTTWASTAPAAETVSTQTTNFTAAFNTIYLTTNAISVQLPTPVANGRITIKKKDSSVVTVLRAASETIDGSAGSITLAGDKESVVLITDGTNWFIISGV